MFSHVWLELNTCKTVVIEQEMYCFNMQIPYMYLFFFFYHFQYHKRENWQLIIFGANIQ